MTKKSPKIEKMAKAVTLAFARLIGNELRHDPHESMCRRFYTNPALEDLEICGCRVDGDIFVLRFNSSSGNQELRLKIESWGKAD